MNEDFAYLVDIYGPPMNAEAFSAADASTWKGKLPNGLIELWLQYGIGMWADGKFQFCRPDHYADIVKIILEGDPQFNPAVTHAFGFGAFGDLLLWNEKLQNLNISLAYLRGRADAAEPDFRSSEPNIALSSALYRIKVVTKFTLFENTKAASPIFKKCVQRYGHLSLGECYGLFPALALGGSTDIGSVRRVRALEHFAILAQLGPIRLVEYLPTGDTRIIRNLGSQG